MVEVASTFFKTLNPTQKSYFKIFFYLVVLTGLELFFLKLPLPPVVVKIMVCTASVAKAFLVGWYYMHLGHETNGLKVFLLFPLFVAFFYAVVLIPDSHLFVRRHANPYVGEPARFYGPRNLIPRRVDDFGNTIVQEPSTMVIEEDGHEVELRGQNSSPSVEKTAAAAKAPENAASASSSSSSEAAKP